jgi:hypothetical protein
VILTIGTNSKCENHKTRDSVRKKIGRAFKKGDDVKVISLQAVLVQLKKDHKADKERIFFNTPSSSSTSNDNASRTSVSLTSTNAQTTERRQVLGETASRTNRRTERPDGTIVTEVEEQKRNTFESAVSERNEHEMKAEAVSSEITRTVDRFITMPISSLLRNSVLNEMLNQVPRPPRNAELEHGFRGTSDFVFRTFDRVDRGMIGFTQLLDNSVENAAAVPIGYLHPLLSDDWSVATDIVMEASHINDDLFRCISTHPANILSTILERRLFSALGIHVPSEAMYENNLVLGNVLSIREKHTMPMIWDKQTMVELETTSAEIYYDYSLLPRATEIFLNATIEAERLGMPKGSDPARPYGLFPPRGTVMMACDPPMAAALQRIFEHNRGYVTYTKNIKVGLYTAEPEENPAHRFNWSEDGSHLVETSLVATGATEIPDVVLAKDRKPTSAVAAFNPINHSTFFSRMLKMADVTDPRFPSVSATGGILVAQNWDRLLMYDGCANVKDPRFQYLRNILTELKSTLMSREEVQSRKRKRTYSSMLPPLDRFNVDAPMDARAERVIDKNMERRAEKNKKLAEIIRIKSSNIWNSLPCAPSSTVCVRGFFDDDEDEDPELDAASKRLAARMRGEKPKPEADMTASELKEHKDRKVYQKMMLAAAQAPLNASSSSSSRSSFSSARAPVSFGRHLYELPFEKRPVEWKQLRRNAIADYDAENDNSMPKRMRYRKNAEGKMMRVEDEYEKKREAFLGTLGLAK